MTEPPTQRLQLQVNGDTVEVHAAPDETLLDVLREHLGLFAAKDACQPEGYCGCCTVLVNGRARVACSQAASTFAGKEIVTLEGLGEQEREAFSLAFAAAGASQCGFCSPGIVMKAHDLLRKKPDPSRAEIASALGGNLCRCTGYVKVIDAIEMAGRIGAGEGQPHLDFSGRLGTRTPKYEAFELSLGLKPFIADMSVEGMLHGALCFSDHPRAVVRRIDIARAADMPGVVAIALAGDVAGERAVGCIYDDWPVLVAEG
nr:2Fe-2S iron-sulfur cluster binding domain-containing protein [Actinomycetota bacterium]